MRTKAENHNIDLHELCRLASDQQNGMSDTTKRKAESTLDNDEGMEYLSEATKLSYVHREKELTTIFSANLLKKYISELFCSLLQRSSQLRICLCRKCGKSFLSII